MSDLYVSELEQRLRALLGRQGEDDCLDMPIEWVAIYAELWTDGNPHFVSGAGSEDDGEGIVFEECSQRGASIAEVLDKLERAIERVEAREARLAAEEAAEEPTDGCLH